MDCGYESSEGFSRAFREFHNINPSEVKKGKMNFNLFSKIILEIKVNGGNKLNFQMVELQDRAVTGIKTTVDGNMNLDINKRLENDRDVWESTRKQQTEIMTSGHVWYEIYDKIDETSYNHFIGTDTDNVCDGCEEMTFIGGLYAKITTPKCKYPTEQLEDIYDSFLMVNSCLSEARVKLDCSRNQLLVTNWTMINKEERYIEVYLPVSGI